MRQSGALVYGHRRYVCLVAATEKRARDLLKHLKTELVYNEPLVTDFRQVCYPLVPPGGQRTQGRGRCLRGMPTHIEWSVDALTFPTLPDDACDGINVSGSTVAVVGIPGALRGLSHSLTNGEILRPELVIIDDPQTRESAMSPSQSAERAGIVNADVLGMAGPGRKIAAVMPCTIIRAGDMADTLLDRRTSPRWQGRKYRMLNALPENEKLWEEYGRLRAESLRKGGDGSEATASLREESRSRWTPGPWPAGLHGIIMTNYLRFNMR